MRYVIGIPKSDTCFTVNYDPGDHDIELDDCDIVRAGDMNSLFVAVPFGSLNVRMIPLKDYLKNEAYQLYARDDMAQEDYKNGMIEAAADAREGR